MWDGKFVEDEYAYPEQIQQCVKCGCYLTKDPTRIDEGIGLIVEWKTGTYPDGQTYAYDIEREITQEEIEAGVKPSYHVMGDAYWECSRCGYEHNSNEMFI